WRAACRLGARHPLDGDLPRLRGHGPCRRRLHAIARQHDPAGRPGGGRGDGPGPSEHRQHRRAADQLGARGGLLMGPPVDPVDADPGLRSGAEVGIIGGGIIGACPALFLAEQGIPVVLCEKGDIAGEQSSRNWGWVRKTGRDPREIPLIIESLRLWQGMNQMVEAETGFRQAGISYLAEAQAELTQFEAWLEHARQYQLDTRIISRSEAAELMPGLTGDWTGALYTASDGKAEPQRASPAIAEAARRHGAAIITQCAVRGIETAGGRVSGVVAEKGRIACDTVVLAGGAWCRLFCGNLDIEL